jgi:hypothetical protein
MVFVRSALRYDASNLFFGVDEGVAQHTKSGLGRRMAIYLPPFFNSLYNKSIAVSKLSYGGAIGE